MTRRMLVFAATTFSLALWQAGVAGADWAAVQTLPSRPFGELRLASDGNGAAILAWSRAPANATSVGAIDIARRPPGGVFGLARRQTPTAQDVRAMGLAASPGGRAVLAWRVGERSAGARLLLVRGRTSGSFGAPRRIASTGTLPNVGWSGAASHPADPVVAVADDGRAVVAWLAAGRRGCGYVVRAMAVTASGQLGAPRRVSSRCPHASGLRGAVDAAGDGALTWRSGARCNYGTACHYAIQAATVAAGRARAGATISRHVVAANGLALAAGGGRTIVVWRDAAVVQRALTRGRVLASTLRGGRWSAPVAISVADRISGVPTIAVGAHGEAVAAWQAVTKLNRPTPVQVVTAARDEAGFSAPHEMTDLSSGFGYGTGPLAAIAPSGRALVAWTSVSGDVVSASRVPDGAWTAAGTLAKARSGLALAAGAADEVLAAWTSAGESGAFGPVAWSVNRPPS